MLSRMNCPTCGTPIEIDQQFCRTCGTGLVDDTPRRVRPQMVMLIALLVIFGGIMAALGGDMAGVRWLKFTGVIIAIAGMFSMVASSLILEMLSPKPSQVKRTHAPVSVERAGTTNKLLPVGENNFAASVVEDTTELLKAPQPVKRKQQSSGQ